MGTEIAVVTPLPPEAPQTDAALRAKLMRLAGRSPSSSLVTTAEAMAALMTLSQMDLQRMRASLRSSLEPSSDDELIPAMQHLRFRISRRATDPEDWTGTLLAYAEILREYPRDVALTALKRWPQIGPGDSRKFWPNEAELRGVLNDLAAWRFEMRAAIERAMVVALPAPGDDESEEDREYVRKGLANLRATFLSGRNKTEITARASIADRLAARKSSRS